MRKNLILGVVLISVMLMSIIGVSAQITGEATITGMLTDTGQACGSNEDCDSNSAAGTCMETKNCQCASDTEGGGKTCREPGTIATKPTTTRSKDTSTTSGRGPLSTTGTKTSSSASAGVPRGWLKVKAFDGSDCYVKEKKNERSLFRGRFLGKLIE